MYNKQIETFIYTADCGSFSKAAEALFLSTVAVIKQINALEQRLGFKLLNRTTRGITLTPAGHLFYEDSKTIIAMSKHSIQRSREAAHTARATICIGTSAMRPHGILSEFNLNCLPFQYKVFPFSDETVGDLLRVPNGLGDRIDCIAAPYDPSLERHCSFLHLKNMPYRIAVPRAHRLAKKRRLSPENLHGETLHLIERGHASGADALREMLQTGHPEVRIKDHPTTVEIIDLLNECIETNELMLTLDIWSDLHPSALTLPVAWNAAVPYGLLFAKAPSFNTQEFIHALCNFGSIRPH